MKTIWKLFVGDIRRITSNVVSIIIVIGLVVIPGIFTWFNVAASWDPFANTGNLKFAVANEDDGYRSDLIPVKINIGDQVVNTLRSNDQLDWTFTTKKEAINGTKSGKYYAAVVIPKNFSTRMMTFFASDGDHAEIAYYNNEKKNALAPKITGQGADTVSAQVNETFSETLTSTALSVASQLANQLDKPAAQEQLTQFNGNISDFAETLTDASGTLRTFSTLTQSARHLLESSDGLIANVSGNAKSVGTTLKQAGSGVEDLTGALKTGTTALGTALTDSANSFTAMEADVDSLFGNAGTQAGNTANALRNQATNISKQAQSYQQIYDSLDALSANEKLPEAVRNAIDHLKTNVGTTITQLNDLASALNGSADNIDAKVSDTTAERAEIKKLAQQAATSVSGIKTDYESQLKPQLDDIATSITSTTTALSVASQLANQLDKPAAQEQLTQFNGNISDFAETLTDASGTLRTFSTLTQSARHLLESSDGLIANVSGNAKSVGTTLKQAGSGVEDLTGALKTGTTALGTALTDSANSFTAMEADVDSLFGNAGTQAGNTANALRNQATNISKQAQSYQQIYDSLDALSANEKLPEAVRNAIDHLKTNVGTTITQLNDLASALNGSADNIDAKVSDTTAERAEIKKLAQQAATSVSGIKTDYESQLKPQLDDIATSITSTTTALNATAADLKGALGNLNGTTKTADKNLTAISSVLDSTADSLAGAGKKLGAFTGTLTDALNSGDMSAVKDVLSDNTDSLAAALAAPVKVKRNAVFPVKNFGSQMAPFYTILPLWVGSLLMAVTLKTTVSRKVRKELGDPKPHQLFLGHYGVFGVIGLLQSTFSLGGSLLFLHVQAVHPLLFMLSGWVSSLVFSFFTYTLVASFGNVGKAIGVLFLVMQISGANGAYPLAVLPKIISGISPFLPATHSITAMRAAIGGIYSNDYWFAIGALLLFIPPLLLIGLLLRIPLVKFNHWYVSKLESTKVIAA